MATEIKMPQLSDTMNAGKILAWRKNEGDSVTRGDVLAEVETEKANLEIECFTPGVLLKIAIPALSTAKVGEVIAVIGQAGEKLAESSAPSAPAPAATVATMTTTPTKTMPEPAELALQKAPVAPAPATTPVPRTMGTDMSAMMAAMFEPYTPPSAANDHERIRISPLARKIAEQKQIDLSRVHGSGPNGRIIKKDLEGAAVSAPPATASQTRSSATSTPVATPRVAGPLSGTLTPYTKMRETIARRMQQAVTESPHFYVTTSIDMGEAIKLKDTLKNHPDFKGVGLNHFVIKAAAYAIEREPRVNRAVKDNQTFAPEQINIGVITAIEDGLLIPVIHEANKLPLKDIVFEARAAVDRARAGRPSASDLTGGTFSISNMGMFDVESFTAIINPGQGSVLAVSSTKEVPVVRKGQIVVGSVMKVTISVDHRIIDGVMAGNFLKFFKEALETPALLCL